MTKNMTNYDNFMVKMKSKKGKEVFVCTHYFKMQVIYLTLFLDIVAWIY